MTGLIFPDALNDLYEWLKVHPLLADLTAQRVFFRMPENPSAAPFMRLYRVGGGPQLSEAPKLQIRVAHEIWGLQDSDYQAVRQTELALASLYHVAQNELMNDSSVLQNADVTGSTDSPDPDTGLPRIVTDVLMLVSLP